MLGLFKRILSRSDASRPAPAKAAPAARTSAAPLPRPRTATAPVRVTPAAQAVAAVAIPPAPAVSAIPPTPNGTHAYVSLGMIAAAVPESISHKVPANHDQFVAVPLEFIVPQLAQGQVVLTGAELRACAPEYFGALTGHEDVPVTLPLGEIVKQVPPEHFVRKNKRRVEVPQEVASVFSSNGQGITISRATPAAAAPAAPAYRAQPSVTTTSAQPAPAATNAAGRISMSPQALAALKAATAPQPEAAPTPARPAVVPRAMTPAPSTQNAPASPVAPTGPSASIPSLPASRSVAPVPKRIPSLPAKPQGTLAVPLGTVCPEWDQEVRKQLADVEVEQHRILVPLEFLEPAMKSGRVLFSWTEVASWIQPPLLSPPTPKVGEMPVELPLKILAPLFMASQNGASGKRVSIDETIPDLFGGTGNGQGSGSAPSSTPSQPASRVPQAAPAPPRVVTPAPVAPAPAPRPAPVSAPAPAPSFAVDEITLEQVAGDSGSRLGAKEIVSNTARLPGVAGALLAMSDGLLVTSNLPPAVKGETIAAFLPQMFGRMNQYTKELALGPLQQLTLGVEGGQWHVVKSPNIYFAVLGKRGETLPLNLLAQVAAELSSQSK